MEEKQLREELTQELELLIVELNKNQPIGGKNITTRLEKALTQSLLLEFIDRKKEVFSRIQLATQQAATEIPIAPIEKELAETEKVEENKSAGMPAQAYSEEVKVLPHPEGPPIRKSSLDYSGEEDEEGIPQPNSQKEVSSVEAFIQAPTSPPKSWELGLNDRISLTKQLFRGNSSDYNRVISQLSTQENYENAKAFLLEWVKPEYDWAEKQEFEERLLDLLEAHFNSKKR
jgi:hypothetical protein